MLEVNKEITKDEKGKKWIGMYGLLNEMWGQRGGGHNETLWSNIPSYLTYTKASDWLWNKWMNCKTKEICWWKCT